MLGQLAWLDHKVYIAIVNNVIDNTSHPVNVYNNAVNLVRFAHRISCLYPSSLNIIEWQWVTI